MITLHPPLSPAESRLREALRLDLEDEQKSLIEDVWHRSHRLLSRVQVQVPPSVERSLPAPDLVEDLSAVCVDTRRLREVNQALERLSQGVYGRCERCGDTIPMATLAHDTTRHLCTSCDADARAKRAVLVEERR